LAEHLRRQAAKLSHGRVFLAKTARPWSFARHQSLNSPAQIPTGVLRVVHFYAGVRVDHPPVRENSKITAPKSSASRFLRAAHHRSNHVSANLKLRNRLRKPRGRGQDTAHAAQMLASVACRKELARKRVHHVVLLPAVVGANARSAQTQHLRPNARARLLHDLCLTGRRTGDDVRSKGQLLEGLHCRLELVGIRRVHLSLRQALLLTTDAKHRVYVLQVHLLAHLTKARHLLTKARDPLTKARRLLLRAKPSLNARQAQLRGLKPKVPGRLRTLQSKPSLLGRNPSRLLLRAKTRLDALQAELRTLHAELGAKLSLRHPKLCCRLGETRLLGLCTHCRLGRCTGETRSFQPKLGAKLSFGYPKLCCRLRNLCRLRRRGLLLTQPSHPKLCCLQTCAANHLCATEANVRPQPGRRLLTCQRLFKRGLRSLRCALKATGPHLCSSAALLLQNISLQLLFRHSLPRSAESARAYGLRPQTCARNLAFTADVSQSLLNCSVFKLTHKWTNP
jgi:hypothetical protein